MKKQISMIKFIGQNMTGIKIWLPVVFVLLVFSNALTIIISIINRQIFDAYSLIDINILLWVVLIFVVTYAFIGLLHYTSKTLQRNIYNKIKRRVQLDFYKAIQKMDYAYYVKHNPSDFYYRMFSDVIVVVEFFIKIILDFPLRILVFFVVLSIMFVWSKWLSCVVIILAGLQWLFTIIFMKPINKNLKELKVQEQSNMSQITIDFEQLDTIRSLSMESYKYNETAKALKSSVVKDNKQNRLLVFYSEILVFLNGVGGVIILLLGLYLSNQGAISLGTVVAFSSFIAYFGTSLSGLIGIYTNYNQSKICYARIKEFLYNSVDNKINKYSEPINDSYDINIRDLCFDYCGKIVFTHYNLKIEAGSFVLIKGGNGCGKTTLCKLLARFLYPTSGMIYLGNQVVEDIKITHYKKAVIFLGQSTILQDSMRANLDFDKQYSDEQIYDIIKKCNLMGLMHSKDWTLDLPSVIMPSQLSSGEKQKISIARVIIRNPKVLILDEPTANMDDSTTKQIVQYLMNYNTYTKATVIVTSHDSRLDSMFDKKILLQ